MFEITGSTGSINLSSAYVQGADGDLSFIADAGGITEIDVDGTVSLAGDLLLDLSAYSGLTSLLLIDNDGADAITGTLSLAAIGPA